MEPAYTVKRSARRKKLTITVERDRSVVVHASETTSDEAIREIMKSRWQWIQDKTRHAQKLSELPHPPGKELVNGESALYLGRQYQLEIVQHGGSEIQLDRRFLIPASATGKRKGVLRGWYVKKANEKILPRVESLAHELGVKYGRARITDSRYRWGSCTAKDNVNLNWRLIKAPMHVIDYVIVHELAHLLEANHTSRFWNIVRTQSPKMAAARLWLKDHGQILQEEV